MKKKKEATMKVTYQYTEPNTKEEKERQERSIRKAYELLFEATLEDVEIKNPRS